ncbi:nucleoside-diphosphate-sugar epimerase [Rhizobium sp. BK529]|uniref:SDR family oxidoreductase n=1 Tax=unclassified Rhizobium TaxID=2613769 RepID=UPI00104A8087|nr:MULTISPECIES: SDR family oxidoreductase [unclassified Rhizobium]MBB3590478.1 nucleoside-diphosphate-sugar epimerase [Rhizobium sp. BK529]TCS05168.1 nucleoside-diphosphate-sugar epimerase [Rhizobium sp. BK418]
MALKILFIGGTGQISYPCVERAVAEGHDVSVFNRGLRGDPLPAGVTSIVGELGSSAYADLAKANYDVVAQFIAFTPDQIARDIEIFSGHCGQYIFISSASVYEKPARHYVITEETPAINPYWPYSQAKIACEELLKKADNLAWTIVRPSHTVRTGLPIMMGDSDIMARRMLDGEPTIVAGDGHTPWTLTRSADFAVPFVGLFGKQKALQDIFHITNDRAHIWDDIQKAIARLLGVEAKIVHVPTDTLVKYNPEWIGPLTGDKAWTAIFDNSKVKSVAGDFTCAESLDEILAEPIMHLKQRFAKGRPPKGAFDALIDRICAEQSALG